jgi:hypothetical protein
MRMADEVDAGQASGEIAKQGRQNKGADFAPLSINDVLGKENTSRLNEWRAVRDAGMPVVEEAIEAALADGRSRDSRRRLPRHRFGADRSRRICASVSSPAICRITTWSAQLTPMDRFLKSL